MSDNNFEKAKNYSLNYLSAKERTEGELRKKLKERGYPEDIIDQTLDYVKNYGYIDHERYVRIFLDSYSRRSNKSLRQIKAKLFEKGIPFNFVDEQIEIGNAFYDEIPPIEKVLKKRMRKTTEKHELRGYLRQRGFTAESVDEALEAPSN